MQGIGKIFDTKYGSLIFALLSGCAYFIIVLDFIMKYTENSGALLGFFFFPAIICGMGLVLLKAIKRLRDEEAFGKINMLVYAHIVLFLISLVFLYDIII
ncbi:MAG: hypothetical protein J6C82_04565 [Clostridia bacterium]|nr:hypothetical protein [Clostridia bacterium]